MGEWVDKEVAWYDQSMTYCACCGLVIPKSYWEAEVGARRLSFASPIARGFTASTGFRRAAGTVRPSRLISGARLS